MVNVRKILRANYLKWVLRYLCLDVYFMHMTSIGLNQQTNEKMRIEITHQSLLSFALACCSGM